MIFVDYPFLFSGTSGYIKKIIDKNKYGKIIGITSVVGLTGNPGQSNYTASKSGMISMYKSIALEVAQRNININLIAPGFIESPMTDALNDLQKNTINSLSKWHCRSSNYRTYINTCNKHIRI